MAPFSPPPAAVARLGHAATCGRPSSRRGWPRRRRARGSSCFSTRPSPAGSSTPWSLRHERSSCSVGPGIDDALLRQRTPPSLASRWRRRAQAARRARLQRGAAGRAVEVVLAQAGDDLVLAPRIGRVVGDRRHRDGHRERRERRGGRGRQHRWEPSHVESPLLESTVTLMPPPPGEQAVHERRRVCENRKRRCRWVRHTHRRCNRRSWWSRTSPTSSRCCATSSPSPASPSSPRATRPLRVAAARRAAGRLRAGRRDAPRQLGLRALPADPRVLRRAAPVPERPWRRQRQAARPRARRRRLHRQVGDARRGRRARQGGAAARAGQRQRRRGRTRCASAS